MIKLSILSAIVPSEARELLDAVHPKARQYGDMKLYNGTSAQLGYTNPLLDDRSDIVLTDNPTQSNEMTQADFLAWAAAEIAKEHTGRELNINLQCGEVLQAAFFSEEVAE